MNPMTPEQLITLFKTFIQDPRFKPVELSSFKDTIAVLEEYSEIKPQYEAEVARLQNERDEAVEELADEITTVDKLASSLSEITKCILTEDEIFKLEIKTRQKAVEVIKNKFAELEKDKAIVDFIEKCLWFKCVPTVIRAFKEPQARIGFNIAGEDDTQIFATSVRAAIDAAMEAESE